MAREDGTRRNGIICAGNWIVDIVCEIDNWPNKNDLTRIRREARSVGGGAANVAMALARFKTGLPIIPFGALGDDEHASFVFDTCEALKLPTEHLIRLADVDTAHTMVMSVPGESRTFFYQGGANDALTVTDFSDTLLSGKGARLFYMGYLLLLEQLDKRGKDGKTGSSQVLARAKQAGMITCADLVSSTQPDFADVVEASLPYVDYLILNEVEACRAARMPVDFGDEEPENEVVETSAKRLIDGGVGCAVIIHCPTKALWLSRDGQPIWSIPEPLPSEKIASPVGAGDAFCAGILYGIHEDYEPRSTLALAHSSAAASLGGLSATGAIPPLATLQNAPIT